MRINLTLILDLLMVILATPQKAINLALNIEIENKSWSYHLDGRWHRINYGKKAMLMLVSII